jgi:hypothetical protein
MVKSINIFETTVDDVMSVYSGINGRCCCGCSGNHRYNSKHVKVASKHRGYKVTPEEVSDRTVKMILNKLKRNPECIDVVPRKSYNFFSGVIGSRLYVVYLLPE